MTYPEANEGGDPLDATSACPGAVAEPRSRPAASADISAKAVEQDDKESSSAAGGQAVEEPIDAKDDAEAEIDESSSAWLKRIGPYRRWRFYKQTSDDRLDLHRRRDAQENERSRLQDGEQLSVPAIWVTELYTPTTVSSLLQGISRLNWDYGKSGNDSLIQWMSDVRAGRSAGWTSLGLVSDPDRRQWFTDRVARLPSCVHVALPVLESVTSSVTALTVCFLLTEEAALRINEPLKAEYRTDAIRDPRFRRRHAFSYILWNGPVYLARTIDSPAFRRRHDAHATLSSLEEACAAWVRRALPGSFASQASVYPTSVLLVSDKAELLTDASRSVPGLDAIGMGFEHFAFRSEEWTSVRMVMPVAWRTQSRRMQFGCRRADAFPPEAGSSDPTSDWTIGQRANDYLRGITSRWALGCLLDDYHELLSQERDRAASGSRRRTGRDLRFAHQFVRTHAYDMLLASAELQEFAKRPLPYGFDVLTMYSERNLPSHGVARAHLLERFRTSQVERTEQVSSEAGLLLSTLTTSADLAQALSNLRIQWALAIVTIASVAVAVIALLLAL